MIERPISLMSSDIWHAHHTDTLVMLAVFSCAEFSWWPKSYGTTAYSHRTRPQISSKLSWTSLYTSTFDIPCGKSNDTCRHGSWNAFKASRRGNQAVLFCGLYVRRISNLDVPERASVHRWHKHSREAVSSWDSISRGKRVSTTQRCYLRNPNLKP